jgi:hypothetical protein
MTKAKMLLACFLFGGMLLLTTSEPARAEGGVGIGISFGGNRGTAVHVFVGSGRDPGWGYGWGISSPTGLNGSPTWGGGGYGLCPPRPYPQPIPTDKVIEMKMPTYGWYTDPSTGRQCYGIVGQHVERIPVHTYIYP